MRWNCGTPVLARPVAAISYVIQDGESGFIWKTTTGMYCKKYVAGVGLLIGPGEGFRVRGIGLWNWRLLLRR